MIALVGDAGSGKSALADALWRSQKAPAANLHDQVRQSVLMMNPVLADGRGVSRHLLDAGLDWELMERTCFGEEIRAACDQMRDAVRASVGPAAWAVAVMRDVRERLAPIGSEVALVEGVTIDAEARHLLESGCEIWGVVRDEQRLDALPVSFDLISHVLVNDGTRTSLREQARRLIIG